VLVDGQQVPATELEGSNSTHAYIYFTYGQSEHEIIIVPEYPTAIALSITLIAVATITAMTVKKRNKSRT
jgi:hypothetical protein